MATEIVNEVASTPWNWIVPLNTMFVAATAVGAWLFSRGGKEALLQAQLKAAEDMMKSHADRADKAERAYADLFAKLQEHMLHDASAFAKLEALTAETARSGNASEQRLTNAIEKLVNRVDEMSNRFDGFLTRIAPYLHASHPAGPPPQPTQK